MKAKESLFLVFGLVCATSQLRAQGNFQNLNFEAANIPGGTQPGAPVPFISALPGWGGSYSNLNGIVQATQATYEGISLGGAAISIIDSNAAQYGFIPLQGRYSAFLFGGISSSGDSTYSTIAQTGLVPNGSISLLMDVNAM